MGRMRTGLAAFVLALIGLFGASTLLALPAEAKKSNKSSKKKVSKAKKKLPLAPPIKAKAPYQARSSVGEIYVTNAKPGTSLLLVNPKNRVVQKGKADRFGSKIFYELKQGAVFTVRTKKNKKRSIGTAKVRVRKGNANPAQSFYDKQVLQPGLNYITMRDGVELAMTVRLPMGKSMADGPFPTFIEHSGYQTAAPHDLISSILASIGGAGGESDPLAPATSTAVGSVVGPLLDFAVVSVQMRGSGCSGGAYDLFGLPTTYDGYDMVETVAAQPWVKGKVGMGGISYSGISQLFSAGTQPPSLAAISPMSVTDDIYQGTGFPGGIFNNGFAYSWITERAEEAKPAPEFGQTWSKVMSTTGDPDVAEPLRTSQKQHCLENQKLRLQTRDYNNLIETNPHRTPVLFDDRAPAKWLAKVKVPVFLVGMFQDEQTGGHWPEAIAGLKNNSKVWVTLQNGAHVDSLGPSTITKWAEFMNLYVGERVPVVPPFILPLGGELYKFLADAGALPIEQSRFASMANTPENVAAAKATYESDPRIRILMENGAAIEGDPGSIGARWETGFNNWPIPSLKPTQWFLGKGGALTSNKGASGSASYTSDPKARPARTLGANAQDDSWLAQPPYDWQPVVDGKGLGFTTGALTQDTMVAGPGSLDLWLKSTHRNTDLQVTVTEVRPDGKETYVQNGWLRASHRAIDKKASTVYNPVQTWIKKDRKALTKGKFNYARVQIFPFAHMFRAGSKIRINVQAPGGDRTIWDFATIEKGKTKNTIGLGGSKASKLVLPVIPGVDSKGTTLPPPTALRGQPSRDYKPATNGG